MGWRGGSNELRVIEDHHRITIHIKPRVRTVDDTIKGVMEDNEDEADEIVDQVLDEIGIELGASVWTASRQCNPVLVDVLP